MHFLILKGAILAQQCTQETYLPFRRVKIVTLASLLLCHPGHTMSLSFDGYQIILVGDTGSCVHVKTCPKLLDVMTLPGGKLEVSYSSPTFYHCHSIPAVVWLSLFEDYSVSPYVKFVFRSGFWVFITHHCKCSCVLHVHMLSWCVLFFSICAVKIHKGKL